MAIFRGLSLSHSKSTRQEAMAQVPFVVVRYVLSVDTVRDEIQLTQEKNPTKLQGFFLSWIVSDEEVVSVRSLLRHWKEKHDHMKCKLTHWS